MKSHASRAIAIAILSVAAQGSVSAQSGWTWNNNQDQAEAQTFASSKPAPLQPLFQQLYRDGEWNAVLNFNQLGLAAMQLGYFDVARKAFDQAIARIEQIYADDPSAQKALSMFNEEKVKDFKGEPYERAMTYYYRGLLYAQEGDFQNARAAFLAADIQASRSQTETFSGDFGLMKYLAGWCSICDGDAPRGRALIEEAKRSDSKIAGLPDQPGRAMVLVDSGPAPRKTGVGEHKQALKIEPGGDADGDLVVRGTGGTIDIRGWYTGGDIYVQASTRGGRQVDVVLDGKAKFKDDTDKAGDVAMDVGTAMLLGSGGSRDMGVAGAVIGLIGLIAKGVAAATTPAADTRTWTSLPARVMLHTADLPPVTELTLTSSTSTAEVPLPLLAARKDCWIGWGRTRSALPSSAGGTAELYEGAVETSNREQKNAALRALLTADFTVATAAPAPSAGAQDGQALAAAQDGQAPAAAQDGQAPAAAQDGQAPADAQDGQAPAAAGQ